MRKIALSLAAAVLGAAALATLDAPAASAGAAAQKFVCTAKGRFADTLAKQSHLKLGQFTQSSYIQLTIAANSYSVHGRSATTKQFSLIVIGSVDPRSATLPVTYTPSGSSSSVVGSFNISNVSLGGPTKITSWITDGSGAQPFSVVLKRFDPATSKLFGTFTGKMTPGENSPNAGILKVTGGSFVLDCNFNGF